MILSLLTVSALAGDICEHRRSGTEPCRAECDAGNPQSCRTLGYLLETGLGIDQPPPSDDEVVFHGELDKKYGPMPRPPEVRDIPAAIVAYGKACELGEPTGCLSSGVLQELKGASQDKNAAKANFARAFEGWTASCEKGNGNHCQLMAAAWWGNWGHAEDAAQSYTWSVRACDLNDGRGCWAQGNALLAGRGVEKDVDRGETLHIKSCDALDEIVGCSALEKLYSPKGPKPDAKKMARYTKRSCALDADYCRRDDPFDDL